MRIVCFGELLLRLASPRRELLLQSPSLDVAVGGAEANVAVSLACFGHDARVVSAVPPGPLGEACRGELRRRGVDVTLVAAAPGRLGLYFLCPGAGLRPSEVIYDRADSAFARQPADAVDWDAALAGADWLHVSGVTPALGAGSAEAATRALQAARARGVRVSFDCNYRPKLWQAWNGDAPGILRGLAGLATVLYADERTLAMILPPDRVAGLGGFGPLAAAALAEWPGLAYVAATTRQEDDVDHQTLGGRLATRGGVHEVAPRRLGSIVDRIGSGDAFAAGLLHGLATGRTDADALRFGVAAACLKHSVPGDANLVGVGDVDALLAEQGFGVRR